MTTASGGGVNGSPAGRRLGRRRIVGAGRERHAWSGHGLEKTPLDKAEFEAEDTRSVETFQPRPGESRLQIGVFNDGLAHLTREQAFAWCAERGIGRIEMGV